MNVPACPTPVLRILARAGVRVPIAVIGLLTGSIALLSAADPAGQPRPWFEHALVGLEVGPTGAQFGSDPSDHAYAERFNGRDIVDATLAAGGEYLVIWARDGEYAYYDSKLAPKCPGLRGRDVLREAVEAAAPHDLPVIAYCVVQAGGYALREHPQWNMRAVDGRTFGRVCLNSGYLGHVTDLCAEMLAYGIDGLHIDMLDQGFGPPYGCWCDSCRPLFEERFGHPMPDGVTWDAAWDDMLEFRYATSERFEQQLRQAVRALNPVATVDFNYHGNPPFSWEVGQRPVQHAGNGDFITGETGAWGFSAPAVGLHARFYAAATPGLPFQVVMQRGVRMYHDQTTRPLHDLRWELFTLLSHGSFVTIVDKTAYDGWLDPVAYQRFGAVFAEAKRKREHFGHPLAADVGIWFSSRTRDWVGRADPSEVFMAFHGAHLTMAREHIPWDILLDENASLARLRDFRVVVLPNVGILTPPEIEMLSAYVREGGSLIVTGASGVCGRMGEPLEQSAIEALVGARFVRRLESLDNHVSLGADDPSAALADGIPADWPFLVKGPAVVYEPVEASAIGRLHEPHRTVRQRDGREGTYWPMSAGKAVGPAVLVNNVGRGRVLTFAASPDSAVAAEHRIVEARHFLRNAVRFLHPAPRIIATAPVNVEIIVTREQRGDAGSDRTSDGTADRCRIHFLAGIPAPASTPVRNRPYALPGLIEEPPLYRATLRFDRPPLAVTTVNASTESVVSGDTVRLLIDDIHEIVVVDLP